mgnify:CR=1 FL=1
MCGTNVALSEVWWRDYHIIDIIATRSSVSEDCGLTNSVGHTVRILTVFGPPVICKHQPPSHHILSRCVNHSDDYAAVRLPLISCMETLCHCHDYIIIVGKISPWTGRFYSLLDPSYAKNNIPIIASVSEHQPTAWSSFYFDLQMLVFMFPGELRWFSCVYDTSASNLSTCLWDG